MTIDKQSHPLYEAYSKENHAKRPARRGREGVVRDQPPRTNDHFVAGDDAKPLIGRAFLKRKKPRKPQPMQVSRANEGSIEAQQLSPRSRAPLSLTKSHMVIASISY